MSRHEGMLAQRIAAVLKAESDRLDHLVLATDLNPATDLRYGNWRGFDLADADLRGFNFTGADLTGARFDNARIAGAVFDRAVYDLPSLRKAADFDKFLKREIGRPSARRPRLLNHRLKDFEVIRDTPLCPELVVIPAGEFLMGSAQSEASLKGNDQAFEDEIVPGQGKRPMRIARRFALGRYPVTFEEYNAFLTATAGQRVRGKGEAGDNKWGRGRRPVINVSWHDARDYCAWLNRMLGLQAEFGYRLPTESEWEYACRAGTNTRRWWGDDWDPTKANGDYSFERGRTSPVGYYAANPWGLYDMIGNVWEWCADQYCNNISMLPADGTAYEKSRDATSSSRVLRGGCWSYVPRYLRSADRYRSLPDGHYFGVGVRVARTL
jgi:formylglycine-generating enzyme required for sulfatase activity